MLIALSMKSEQPFSFIRALDKLLSYKGIDERDLQFKRTLWFTTFGISCFVSAMFIPVLVFQVKTLLLFGILLLCIYIPSLILMFILPYKNKSIVHISQHLTILITFYCIVKLGGLHQSGGIILAGLSMVITSATMFNSNRWSVWYFSLYMVCTLIVAGIQMKYKISPEMPSHVNHIFSLINTLCLSAYTLVIVLVYIKQYTQIEKGKADHLRHLDDVKTKLYTNITHEFRTPLTVIEGMADQIESQPDKWLKRGLEKIRQNSRNLLHLVDQMLDLARLEAGALPMKMVHGDVIRYLKMLSESFDSLAESKGITLSFSSDIDSYCTDYDADKLGKILTNLLSNAIKYTASEGVVSVNVSMVDRSGTKLILEFTDTGIGIESEKLGKIFDRFYRVEKRGL